MSAIVDILFLASLFLPPVAVVLGCVLLAGPRRHTSPAAATAQHTQAHAH